MKSTLRKTFTLAIAAIMALAVVIPTNQAAAGDKHIAKALIGGLVVGAIIGAHSRPAYGAPQYHAPVYQTPVYQAPVYHEPAYHPPVYRPQPRPVYVERCFIEKRRVWDPYYGTYVRQKVRICN